MIDATTPLTFLPDAPPALAVSGNDSGGEQVPRWLARSTVVKAFNTIGRAHMFQPQFPGGPPDLPITGNDASAKQAVTALCQAFGWSVIDLGGTESARYREALAMAWIRYGARTNTWNHAWKLLRQ